MLRAIFEEHHLTIDYRIVKRKLTPSIIVLGKGCSGTAAFRNSRAMKSWAAWAMAIKKHEVQRSPRVFKQSLTPAVLFC